MSAPITEAHLRLANQLVASPPSPLVMATLIADSEARAKASLLVAYDVVCGLRNRLATERDQLRADCENETKWAAHYLADAQNANARAERAELEVERLKSDGAASAFIDMACRASHAEAELANIRALANRRNKQNHSHDTTHQLVASLDQALDIAQAELAAERARLERIRRNCSVFYWSQGKDPYPIEHNPRAGKDQWETIDAAVKEDRA